MQIFIQEPQAAIPLLKWSCPVLVLVHSDTTALIPCQKLKPEEARVEEQPRAPKDLDSKRKPDSGNQDLWRLLGLGVQLTVTVGLFVALGWWLEQRYSWPSWSRTAISLLGVAVALYHFVKEALR